MEIIEAECGRCGEIFNLADMADMDDTEHLAKEDGQHCGGQGTILGTWIRSTDVNVPNARRGTC